MNGSTDDDRSIVSDRDAFPEDPYLDDDDESSLADDEANQGIIGDEPNKFETLCDGVLNTMALLHQSLKEFLLVKDILIQNYLPPSVILSLSLTSSKVFRSVTDLHEPLHELVRMVRIFSTPWEEKSAALKKLHDDFHKKRRQLDVAIRRLNLIDAASKKIAYERKILNWEKLYCKVTSAKGHGRRWKYTIDQIKEQAKQGYDVLVRQVDQVEDTNEPFPEPEQLRIESQAPQMDTIAEEHEEASKVDEESGGDQYSEASDDLEESIDPETLRTVSGAQVPVTMEPPKPEVTDFQQVTHGPDYDVILFVRCYCPKGIEGREIKCSFTHGSQYEKSSRLDLTDEEIAQELAAAPPPKPKGPMRRGAPPPPPEPEPPKIIKFSELRFPLHVTRQGRREIPPTLKSLTVSVHVGENEDIIGMNTIEVEDIEGCEMPVIFQLPESDGALDLSLQDSLLYTDSASVDAELQLQEPLPVSFPIYPLGGGRAGSELKAVCSVPLFFYYKKIYKPKCLSRSIATGTVRDIIMDELGVDILFQTKDTLFPDRADMAISPMTVAAATPPPAQSMAPEDGVTIEEFDELVQGHQREMKLMQQTYELQMQDMQMRLELLETQLKDQPQVAYERASSGTPGPRQFVFKKEQREMKKIPSPRKLPKWGDSLPTDFFERLEMFREESEANRRAIAEHVRREESDNIEKKLAFQHKAFRGSTNDVADAIKDVSLPALYHRNNGSNVYNPRVGQYFHPTGSTGLRLTQPPSCLNLPPLKNKMSVLNLFDLGQSIHNPNQLLQKYMAMRQAGNETANMRSEAPVNTADGFRETTVSAAERLETTNSKED